MTTNSQKTREMTPEENFRELYKRFAQLNDKVSALLAPAWGSEMGIIPASHPLYQGEKSSPALTEEEATARVFAGLHRSAEEDVTRVIDLYERWVKAGPPPLGTPIARWWDKRLVELHDAILPPDPTHQAGCHCHNGDELCSGCRRCPDICHGCDGPQYPPADQTKEQ
ncbi:hypothetical protein [Streptomyces bobili]|uniref:hypothetical protein n=1 Tax=Streptomyces bobili TaxID=67280 RepID=UPI0037BA973A